MQKNRKQKEATEQVTEMNMKLQVSSVCFHNGTSQTFECAGIARRIDRHQE